MKTTKISLSGLAGSGKTTIGKKIAETLNFQFVSLGNFAREFALKHYGLDINEFQDLCLKNPEIDNNIDREFSQVCNEKSGLIIDYRLAYHFVENCFNVYLHVSENEAVRRLQNAKRADEFSQNNANFIKDTMNARNDKMKLRFIETYETDFTKLENYDLVINTDEYQDFSEIAGLIIKTYNSKTTQPCIS